MSKALAVVWLVGVCIVLMGGGLIALLSASKEAREFVIAVIVIGMTYGITLWAVGKITE